MNAAEYTKAISEIATLRNGMSRSDWIFYLATHDAFDFLLNLERAELIVIAEFIKHVGATQISVAREMLECPICRVPVSRTCKAQIIPPDPIDPVKKKKKPVTVECTEKVHMKQTYNGEDTDVR